MKDKQFCTVPARAGTRCLRSPRFSWSQVDQDILSASLAYLGLGADSLVGQVEDLPYLPFTLP